MPEEYQDQNQLVDWQGFETILLDMDGTILDLAFDNYFWRKLVPTVYAKNQGISKAQASDVIYSLYTDRLGTLEWYCLDFWSEQLNLDLRSLKHESRDRICFLPGVPAFLDAVKQQNKRLVQLFYYH